MEWNNCCLVATFRCFLRCCGVIQMVLDEDRVFCFELETGGFCVGLFGLVQHFVLIVLALFGYFSTSDICEFIGELDFKHHSCHKVVNLLLTVMLLVSLKMFYVSYRVVKGVEWRDHKTLRLPLICYALGGVMPILAIYKVYHYPLHVVLSLASSIVNLYSCEVVFRLYCRYKFMRLDMRPF